MVEILVILAIISVLTMLLMPVIMQARDSANCVRCLSNLRQVATAFQIYAADNRSFLPHEDNGDSRPPYDAGWYVVLKPQLNEPRAFLCPNEYDQPRYYSIKMNSLLETEERPFFSITWEHNAAQTVLLFDGRINNAGVRLAPKGTWNMVSERHRGTANIIFTDLHAEGVIRPFDDAGWEDEGGLVWDPTQR
jgi:prepilin-type processing-associated H-X9-DG protein